MGIKELLTRSFSPWKHSFSLAVHLPAQIKRNLSIWSSSTIFFLNSSITSIEIVTYHHFSFIFFPSFSSYPLFIIFLTLWERKQEEKKFGKACFKQNCAMSTIKVRNLFPQNSYVTSQGNGVTRKNSK